MKFHLNRAFALSAVCLAVAIATAPARASNSGTITLYTDSSHAPYVDAPGGAFTAAFDSGSLTDGSYSSLAKAPSPDPTTDFETFCLETLVYFSPDTTYNYTVGLSLQQTDSNQWDTYGPNTTSNHADTGLSVGAAYLYQQYATGALATDLSGSAYNNASFSYTSTASAGALQAAIWDLENENPLNTSVSPTTNLTADLVDLAESKFTSSGNVGSTTGLDAAQALVTLSGKTDSWDVYVLELTNSSGQPVQDQLYYSTTVQVPEGGSTIALLGAALLGLALFYRRAGLQI
jgi:hypothetical protein